MLDLSSGAWGLIGVVVGAVCTGLAQLVAGRLTRQEARRVRAQDTRRAVYADYLAAAADAGVVAMGARSRYQPRTPLDSDSVRRIEAASQRVYVANAQVRLVAPRDTADSAGNLTRAAINAMNEYESDDAVVLAPERLAFVTLAKRDLGVAD